MNIALIGYGKMGHIVEQVALRRGHTIVCTIDKGEESKFLSDAFGLADVAIEFSTADAAESNIRSAWQRQVPVVSGTTGWDAAALLKDSKNISVKNGRCPLVWSSNYSVGVNVFFDLNAYLAEKLSAFPQYHPAITEIHHIHKLDAPSGTAKTLMTAIQTHIASSVPVQSVREGEIPGIHTVQWDSNEDTIIIQHIAKGRQGFALGAVLEAERICNV